jgi:hypothetical protein
MVCCSDLWTLCQIPGYTNIVILKLIVVTNFSVAVGGFAVWKFVRKG